jgi:hypothetical protein
MFLLSNALLLNSSGIDHTRSESRFYFALFILIPCLRLVLEATLSRKKDFPSVKSVTWSWIVALFLIYWETLSFLKLDYSGSLSLTLVENLSLLVVQTVAGLLMAFWSLLVAYQKDFRRRVYQNLAIVDITATVLFASIWVSLAYLIDLGL